MNFKLLLFISLLSVSFKYSLGQKKLICYYTNWSQYRPDIAKFVPEDIDPLLCTHIIYAFAKINVDKLAPYEWNDESVNGVRGMFQRVTDMKARNPNLKVLLAVGGWTFGSPVFSKMVSNPISRATFIYTSINYLKANGFDGIDLDWEFPAYGTGSSPNDKFFFTYLVEEMKQAFTPHGLLLSAAVAVNPKDVDAGYEVDKISRSLDWISLMSYNYHGNWDQYTGFNAPLYVRSTETGQDRTFNVDSSVNYWLNKGVPRNKLIVGTATYGKSFKLSTPSRNQPGDAAYAVGTAGPYTREAGLLSYYEICQKLAQGWKRSYNNEQRVPFADNGNEWVGYDDQQSMKEKGEYVNLKGLGGAMVWSLDLDDFNGKFCGQGRYPLINALKAGLESTTSSSNTNLVGTCTQNHNVVSGETCYLIWTKYGLDEATFYRYNPTINCMPLQIGQVICVKQTTSNTINVNPSGNTICTGTHSVALGETCPLIYGKYGMTEAQLINLNPSLNCNYLPVGLLLNVFKAC